jgi:hypothetical protein
LMRSRWGVDILPVANTCLCRLRQQRSTACTMFFARLDLLLVSQVPSFVPGQQVHVTKF